jgi:hypothetical protein
MTKTTAGLPEEAKSREEWPIYDYQYGYFPDAYLEEVRVAWVGNQQHNKGEPMHWARHKSPDHMNKAMRHLDDYGHGIKKDTDGTYHLAKAIWRLKARLQLDIEAERLTKQTAAPEPVRDAWTVSCGVPASSYRRATDDPEGGA